MKTMKAPKLKRAKTPMKRHTSKTTEKSLKLARRPKLTHQNLAEMDSGAYLKETDQGEEAGDEATEPEAHVRRDRNKNTFFQGLKRKGDLPLYLSDHLKAHEGAPTLMRCVFV